MRVVLASHNAQFGDAIGNQLAAKAAYLATQGVGVRVFVESVRRLHPDLRPFAVDVRSARPSGSIWDAARNADLVSFEFGHDYPLLAWLPWLARLGVPTLADYHGITPAVHQEASRRGDADLALARRSILREADRVIVHSRFMADELVTVGVESGKISTLPPLVDEAIFAPGDPVHTLRQRFGLMGQRVALYVGRIAPNKRISTLVEALALTRMLSPGWHALCVGDDSDVYGLERQRCTRLARERGVADRLHFAGHVSEADLLDAYRSADVFVMPSVHEGHCVPIREALAVGLPILATRSTALPETLGGCGRTFEPDDAAGLAKCFSERIERGVKIGSLRACWERAWREIVLRTLLQPGRCRATEEGIPHEMSRHRGGRLHRLAPLRSPAPTGA